MSAAVKMGLDHPRNQSSIDADFKRIVRFSLARQLCMVGDRHKIGTSAGNVRALIFVVTCRPKSRLIASVASVQTTPDRR